MTGRRTGGRADGRSVAARLWQSFARGRLGVTRAAALFLILGALGPVLAVAQQVPTRLTLDQALELARRHNPAYLRTLARADAAGADVLASVGAFLPSLDGSLSFNGSSRTVVTGTDDFGKPLELEESLTFQNSSSSQSLSTRITVFDGLQNLNNLRGARAGANAAQAGVTAEAARVEGEVKRRFYRVLQAQQLIAVEEQLLAARRGELATTERLFRVLALGQDQVTILGAQVEVSRQEQALESALGEARKALLLLVEQIGLDDVGVLEVVGEFPEEFDPALLAADELVAHVLRENPEMKRAMANAAQADFAASAARGQRLPTISATARFSRQVGLGGYDALFKLNPRDRTFGFGFAVQLPIFTRFSTSQAIARAVVNEREADETLREVRLQLERATRSALIDVENSYRQLQLAERSVELGRRQAEMAREQYQLGSKTFTELQQILSRTANDLRAALNARLNHVSAVTALEELVGRSVRP